MKYFFLSIQFCICLLFNLKAQEYAIPEKAQKILFLGNSITYAGQYVSYIEAYLTAKYPSKAYEFINVGLPSETVSGLSEDNHAGGRFPRPDLHERLERILTQTDPDLIFACYGMNDGIYLPFDDLRFQKFKEGLRWMHKQVAKRDIPIIHLTPPVYDERKGAAYANVLDIYSDWLISQRYTNNWKVIDIHWPMKKYLEDQRLKDATFMYAKDGVHPNEIGHWMMSKQVLLGIGENEVEIKEDIRSALSLFRNGEDLLTLVEERQVLMKDAWLTSIGHERPGMKTGLPLSEAKLRSHEIEKEIQKLVE